MSISEEVKDVVEAQLKEGEFIVDVILKGSVGTQKLIVIVDSDLGMTIEECATISRRLSRYLEQKDLFEGNYTLEVSSPGLDHPLKLKRQYVKNIGRNLRVTTVDDEQIEGELCKVNEGIILLQKSGKGKNEEIYENKIPFAKIKKAMVLVSFRK